MMALRFEKAFGISADTLLLMQAGYDLARARARAREGVRGARGGADEEVGINEYCVPGISKSAKWLLASGRRRRGMPGWRWVRGGFELGYLAPFPLLHAQHKV